jgi:hypothetical protein
MNATLLAALNDAERLLVAQTEPAELAALDEDAAIEFEGRIRRARNKYVGQYRRGASARVAEHGARGQARPENKHAAMKAEAFEEALSRVSRRVAVLARQSAARLRGAAGRGPGREAGPGARRAGPGPPGQPDGDPGHRRDPGRPRPALAGHADAPGQHPGRGRPPAGEARQPRLGRRSSGPPGVLLRCRHGYPAQ